MASGDIDRVEAGVERGPGKDKQYRNHVPIDMIRDPVRRRELSKYYKFLDIVLRHAKHNNTTSNTELEKLLDQFGMLDDGEVGTYTEFAGNSESGDWPTYGIYNTMRGPPGQHWFCCYRGKKYDPLGEDGSRTQEQPDESNNCGQRCVAYLLMCKRAKVGGGVPL